MERFPSFLYGRHEKYSIFVNINKSIMKINTRTILALGIMFGISMSVNAVEKKQQKDFSGTLSYTGKVTRIPDKSKTNVKLQETDASFKEMINSEWTKRVEDINGELTVTTLVGNKQDVWWQTISSRRDGSVLLLTSNREEQIKYGLMPQDAKCNSKKVKVQSNKKRKVDGHECVKVICNMVTTDNIRVQLVAWVATDLRIKGRKTPYFGELSGLPLIYDYYNGKYVVTYSVNDISKRTFTDQDFEMPEGENVIRMSFSEYSEQ